MSIRLEMLQVARLAPQLLGESASLVERFILSQQNPDGGFRDRAGASDLYYTVFGLDSLAALRTEMPSDNLQRLRRYLGQFGAGSELDFVHLCCLVRAWAALGAFAPSADSRQSMPEPSAALARLESFRAADGGYHPLPGHARGAVYGCFLAMGAYQDAGKDMPDPLRLVQCLKKLETPDGAWANEQRITAGSTNATAAAVTLLRHLDMPIHSRVADWLLARFHPEGGVTAAPGAPLPDLLSTATCLHALSGLQASFEPFRETCLDFIDTLWTNEGAFHGHWAEDQLDCEYTYYGLLALGHLSLRTPREFPPP